jgi:hypothetical protein
MRVPAPTRRKSAALQTLTSSALAITGFANHARADSPIERPIADYTFSWYEEEDFDEGGIEVERYEIETHQLSFKAPLRGRMDLGIDLMWEKMSGGSPWVVTPGPVQVMSGATIKDERTDVLLSSSYFFDSGRAGITSGYSTENDYDSWNFGIDGERHFNEKNTTLSGGVGVSLDKIEPVQRGDGFGTRPSSENKQSYAVSLGLSQILGRNTVVQGNLTYKHNRDYLSDPYKVYFAGGFFPDTRPDERNQFTVLTRLRRHFDFVNATLHADYQFYVDDWSMDSHTFELAWHQTLFDHLRLVPHVRYYAQSEADFYSLFSLAPPAPGDEFSNDYRLSGFGAYSYGMHAELDFQLPFTGKREWQLRVGAERYESDGDLAFSKSPQDPLGLVDFYMVSISLGVRF